MHMPVESSRKCLFLNYHLETTLKIYKKMDTPGIEPGTPPSHRYHMIVYRKC